jgi:hypothetical protein
VAAGDVEDLHRLVQIAQDDLQDFFTRKPHLKDYRSQVPAAIRVGDIPSHRL